MEPNAHTSENASPSSDARGGARRFDDAALRALAEQYNDPNRPGPCEECRRRPVPSRFSPGAWVDNHSGSCSQNSALQVCERCGHRHVDRDFGQVLACTMDVPIEEGRAMQRRIVERLER